ACALPICEFDVADAIDLTGRDGRWLFLDPIHEPRCDQDACQCLLDAAFEVAALASFAIELEQRIDFGGADRATIRATRERRENGAGAGRFFRRGGGFAAEDCAAARSISRTGRI